MQNGQASAGNSAPARVYVRDFGPAQFVEGVFCVQNLQLGQTKNGNAYLKGLLSDCTGRTPLRMWNIDEELFHSLPGDGFVEIEGETQPYQGEMQVIIRRIRRHHPTPEELRELLPSSREDPDKMFSQVLRLLGTLTHPDLQALRDSYLADGELMEAFSQAPAAQSLHHAYLGGLLEHTLSLMTVAEAMLPHYPRLNRDLVLFALFLHDLGKCVELQWKEGFGYTEDGQLIGHIARGTLMLAEKAKACEDEELGDGARTIDAKLLRVLQHIILSHHGEPEFGAAKRPATPEALFVSMLDNLDAKMNLALDTARPHEPAAGDLGSDFTEKVWALNNTKLYRPDVADAST